MSPTSASRLLIGTSGFSYPHWRNGEFYPRGLRGSEELRFYSSRFPTVELNNPFYRLPERAVFERWRNQTPEHFVFAVKASRYITHIKRLQECAEPIERLMDRIFGLGTKLGPVLFQFPANWRIHLERLAQFLDLLPRGLRYAFEFRHPEWYAADTYQMLKSHGAGLCLAVAPNLPSEPKIVTADFAYIRMHAGAGTGGNFRASELRHWAGTIAGFLRAGIFVYVYFNNDALGNAVRNAVCLGEMLGVRQLTGERNFH